MSLKDDIAVAKALVAKLEGELAKIPAEIVNKSEQEIADIYHAIGKYFHGAVPEPTPAPAPEVPPQDPAPSA